MWFAQSEDIFLGLLLLAIGAGVMAALGYKLNGTVLDPVVFVGIGVLLYAGVFPAYFMMGGDRISGVGVPDVREAIFLSTLFLVSCYFAVALMRSSDSRPVCATGIGFPSGDVLWLFYVLFLVLSIPAIIEGSGGASKGQRMLEGTSPFQAFFGGTLIPFALLQLRSLRTKGSLNWRLLSIAVVYGLIGFSRLGERDLVVFPLIVTLVLWVAVRRPGLTRLSLVGLVGISGLFALGVVRGWLETGNFRQLATIMLVLQENEFISAGRNLAVLINADGSSTQRTLLGAVFRPFGLDSFPSGAVYFSENFYANKGLGLISEAYLNYGILGILSFGAFIGFIGEFFHQRARSSDLWLGVASVFLLSVLFSLRGDLAAISSGVVRRVLIPLTLIIFAYHLFPHRARDCD